MRATSFTLMLGALVALSAVTGGCSDSATAPSNNAAFTQTDLRVGTGAPAVSGSLLTVHYSGWFYDQSKTDNKGVQFDSSRQTPLSFTVGAGQVISGWELGVVGMREGGLRRLVIPPSLAYGSSRFGPIPPNATLLFDLELLQVQ